MNGSLALIGGAFGHKIGVAFFNVLRQFAEPAFQGTIDPQTDVQGIVCALCHAVAPLRKTARLRAWCDAPFCGAPCNRASGNSNRDAGIES